MMKSDPSSSNNFDRPKLLLFKFLAHQIHPFAYAVNTFLRPALDDCLELMYNNPQDTFNVLLSISQTFTRFAPETELIYDDIQQFAIKLKDSIDQCFTWLDPNTIQQSSQLLETTHQSLLKIIQQEITENTTYTNMYKNMSAVLTNLEKINSLPMEIQTMLNKQEPLMKISKQTVNSLNTTSNRITATSTPPPGILPIKIDKPSSINNQSRSSQNTVLSSTIPLTDQMKTLTVSSTNPIPTTTTSRPVLITPYLNEYEIMDTSTQSIKKSTTNIASFPPRQNASLFTSTNEKPVSILNNTSKMNSTNGHYSSSSSSLLNDHSRVQSKSNGNNNQQRDTPVSTFSNDGSIGFENTSRPQTTLVTSSIHDDWDDEDPNRQNYLNSRFSATTERYPATIITEQSRFDQTKPLAHPHVTDEYIQEFGKKQNRPMLRGELCMTYGTPQSGPQASCLPIGVGLSYDELTLLSCDVHRNAHCVRLFDIQTGRLKHTITSNQQMKFHRPGAVMSNARNNIVIVQKDSIYITEPDGRYIQTINHRSIKQLYGIASFRDRYILTIDSKSIDNQSAENCRLLLFDPNNGQLVFEKTITINHQTENIFKQQYINNIQGKVLSELASKPRFIAAHNDDIYVADLGRSLIYGTTLRNQFDLTCTTVFGGHGRGNGEMNEPSGLFIDSGGNIISADSRNDRIQLFSSDGQYKTTFKLNEYIKRPSGICTNRTGTQFYVSCYLAGCIRAFNIGY